MAAGTYARSLQQRRQQKMWNAETATATILKMFGSRPMSIDDLRQQTGLPEELLKESLDELMGSGLLESDGEGYRLTKRGDKARYFVAS